VSSGALVNNHNQAFIALKTAAFLDTPYLSTMSDSDAAAQAAMAEAMGAALRKFNTQLWTFYAFGVLVTILRTYSRIKAVGLRNFQPDDFIVWVAIVRIFESSTSITC
jgi:hypothetical protein